MEIKQKKKSNTHVFTFLDNHLNFAYKDKSGSGDIDLSYADFPRKASIQIEQNEWLRNVGYLWCVIGAIQLSLALYQGSSISGKGFWLMIGVGCLVWAHFSKVKYSVYKTDRGNIFVIQDKHHDAIIDEINKRKKSQMLEWYGEVDPQNSLEQEIRKFKWLADEKIMSQEESEKKIAMAKLMSNDTIELPTKLLN